MKIYHALLPDRIGLLLPAGGTAMVFDKAEKELVSRIIEGMIEMDPSTSGQLSTILLKLGHEEFMQ